MSKQVSNFFKKVKVKTNHTIDHNSRNEENKAPKRKMHTNIGSSHHGKNSTNVAFSKVVNGEKYPPDRSSALLAGV